MLTPESLAEAMGHTIPFDRYVSYFQPYVDAMHAAHINTLNRCAAWHSQLGHESLGLRFMAEIKTSDPSWSWDRTRYRGRGPIQLTWQSNYRKFGQWCHATGLVDDPELFVNVPELVEQPRWGFLASSWYWLEGGPRRGQINAFADAGDILRVSWCVNGWREPNMPNGWNDNENSRLPRWNRCLRMGDRIVPGSLLIPGVEGLFV